MVAAPALEIRNLTVRLGGVLALDEVHFAVPEGSILAVVGPNGSGKSTLIRSVLGIVKPAAGEIRVLGATPETYPVEQVGYVPQIKALDRTFPGTGLELVVSGIRRSWPWRARGEERERAVQALALLGSERLADRAINAVSGGELQRLYLARALARHARLVLMDEPATGMDVVGEQTLHRFLDMHRRARDLTIVLATHDLGAAADHATHVLLISRRQIAFGPPESVLVPELLVRAFGHVSAEPPFRANGGEHVARA